MDTKTEVEEASRKHASLGRRVLNGLLLCTGDMVHLDEYIQGRKTLYAATSLKFMYKQTNFFTSILNVKHKLY